MTAVNTKRSVFQALILKDWRLHRSTILVCLTAGAVALALVQMKNESAFFIGIVMFFVPLIVVGCLLPVATVVNERKKQTLAFLMSLPVSGAQYARAKVASTVGLFLIPWTIVVAAGLILILSRHDIPDGFIPFMLILAALPFVGFCLIAGAALVSESEGAMMAATIVCNSSYGLSWYFIIRIPAINSTLKSPVPVWNATVLTFLGGEAAAIALILGLTVYLQSRKRSFI